VQALRVMTWNIAECTTLCSVGKNPNTPCNTDMPWNSQLPLIAQRVRERHADLVLLNEVKNWNWWYPGSGGVNQVRELAQLTQLTHFGWSKTTNTFLSGHKAVAVLSRFPLGSGSTHPIKKFAIHRTTCRIANIDHVLFSLRFDAWSDPDILEGLDVLKSLVKAVPPTSAIVAAGDFNTGLDWQPLADWMRDTGLRNTRTERADAEACTTDPTIEPHDQNNDHIFFRGPYQVVRAEIRCALPHPSDHPWVLAELQSTVTEADFTIVPSVVERPPVTARKRIEGAGLVAKFEGPYGGPPGGTTWVYQQTPGGGATALRGSVVRCTLRRGIKP
jgi:endonuclease/exonuclease/phosphatase family metal-dependent hydrolase